MTPYALAIMAPILITFVGLLSYVRLNRMPRLLALLALLAVYGFAPRCWFK